MRVELTDTERDLLVRVLESQLAEVGPRGAGPVHRRNIGIIRRSPRASALPD